MQIALKLLVSVAVIAAAWQIGKRMPTLGGLLATMPLTGALVMLWLHLDRPDDYQLMVDYTKGALWGIAPSILFFVAILVGLRHKLPLFMVIPAGFAEWLLGAIVHQFSLK